MKNESIFCQSLLSTLTEWLEMLERLILPGLAEDTGN